MLHHRAARGESSPALFGSSRPDPRGGRRLLGVTAYAVSRRRAEFGVRIALGASTADVVRTVLQRVVFLMGLGLVIGGAVSFWTSRLVTALLFGVEPRDPMTFAGAAVVLASIALLAGWLPARRAARIESGDRAAQRVVERLRPKEAM